MYVKNVLSCLFILFFSINYSIQAPSDSTTLITAATTTSSETTKSSNSTCPGGYINHPACTECASNYELKDERCSVIKNDSKPTRNTNLRIFFGFLGCLLTVFIIAGMIFGYRRLIQRRRRRSSSNTGNQLNLNTKSNNRFNNILRSIGLDRLNKRGRFNFFSISNNNQSSGQHRQGETSRAPLSENPDEALLFDDPYADGGLNNSSANPYKTLTLAVT